MFVNNFFLQIRLFLTNIFITLRCEIISFAFMSVSIIYY